MSKRCELQKEYYQQYGNYKGNGKYCDKYVSWLENEVLALRQPPVSGNEVALPFDKVTRLEVIIYREGDKSGRVFTHWKDDNKIEGQLQDKDRTLKIFIDKR